MKNSLRITISISLILALISMTGCGSSGGFFKGSSNAKIETYNFRSGSEGVSMQFIDGMPPKQLYVGTDFSIGLKIKNEGAYDITGNADMSIVVPEQSAFSFKGSNPQSFTLTGKSLYVKEGEENVMIFPVKALCFPGYEGTKSSVLQNYTRKIKAKSCYYYETTANSDVCIDTRKHLRTKDEKPVCEMKDVSLSGGQGGPVGVTKISPSIIPQSDTKATFQLGISVKKLKGTDYTVYLPTGGCDVKYQNNVTIDVEMGGKKLECKPSVVTIREDDSVGTLCKTEVDTKTGAFTTPVSVTMKYYVQQSMIKELTIEAPPGGVDCSAAKSSK